MDRYINPKMFRIEQASKDELKAIILYLCKDSNTRDLVTEQLSKVRDLELKEYRTAAGSPKRDASAKIYVCINCDQPFTEETNDGQVTPCRPDTILGSIMIPLQVVVADRYRTQAVKWTNITPSMAGGCCSSGAK